MKFYKNVLEKDGKFYSSDSYGKFRVEYKVGEKVYPPIGKLFVSSSVYRYGGQYKLFLVEAENPEPMTTGAIPGRDELIEEFWKNGVCDCEWPLPLDTYVCDSVILLKEI